MVSLSPAWRAPTGRLNTGRLNTGGLNTGGLSTGGLSQAGSTQAGSHRRATPKSVGQQVPYSLHAVEVGTRARWLARVRPVDRDQQLDAVFLCTLEDGL